MSGVLLLGGDSDFNLGDRAILRAVCSALSSADRRLRLTVTARPGGARPIPEAHGVVPRGISGFGTLLRTARNSELVAIAGGGLFQDDDSRIKMPYWASRIGLLHAARTPLVGHAIGAGPLRHAESRVAARIGCSMLRSISVRDRFALSELEGCTGRPISLTPDPAFMLEAAPAESAHRVLRAAGVPAGKPLIGVSLRRWFHRRGGFIPHRVRSAMGLDRGHGEATMQEFLRQVATGVKRMAAELDAAILLLPSYNVGHEADDRVAARFQAALGEAGSHLLVLDDPALYKAVTGRLSLLVSSRMHPLIFAAAMGVPIVGLGYNPKFAGLFGQLGIEPRLIELDAFAEAPQTGRLVGLMRAAIEARDDLRGTSLRLADQARTDVVRFLHPDSAAAGAMS